MQQTRKAVLSSHENENRRIVPAISMRMADYQAELVPIVADGADIVLLADCRGAADLQKCDVALAVAEARAGRGWGDVKIIASMDSPAGLLGLPTLGARSPRLAGLTWNRAAFCAAMACEPDSAIAEQARIQLLVAARAFDLPVYEMSEA